MKFSNSKSIYIQIADYLCEQILKEEMPGDSRVPSVRELASNIQVNPNTVMRTYGLLQDQGIFYNKRGIGYFVTDNAKEIVMQEKKEAFIKNQLPELFKTMELLKIDLEELKTLYHSHKNHLN